MSYRQIYYCIFISLWTIVQSVVHIYGLFVLMWWRKCTQNSNVKLDFFSTYLVDIYSDCYNETSKVGVLLARAKKLTKSKENSIEDSIEDSLEDFIISYVILDILWIIASVALMTGSCCMIKEFWVLIFNLPWVVLNVLIVLFDVFCATYFGLQIPAIGTFGEWANFIGFTFGINDLKLDEDLAMFVSGAASILMTFLSARGGVIWIINLLLIFYIARVTWRAYRQKFEDETPQNQWKRNISASTRIRNWYMFYGSVERERKGNNNEKDFDAGDWMKSDGFFYADRSVSINPMVDDGSEKIKNLNQDLPSTSGDGFGDFRNHLPWSHVDDQHKVEKILPKKHLPITIHILKGPHCDEGMSKF